MPSWKTAQSKKKKVERTKLALVVLGIVLAILILAQGFKFGQLLFSPWKLSDSKQQHFSWNDQFNINLLVRSDKTSLVSFNSTSKEVTIIYIPDETLIETAHGFGNWQLRAIYQFGELQKGIGGNKLLKDSLSSFFGLPIEGVVEGDLDNMIINKKLSFFSIPSLKTDLKLYDLIRLQMDLSKVRFDKVRQIDLGDLGVLEKDKLADGTEVLVSDPVRLDQTLLGLSDPSISSEHKTITIFNSTNHPGLALKAARLITNLGGEVIIVSNGKDKYPHTQISGEKSKTLDRIKQIFEANDTIDPNSEDVVSSRAQINLFLGEDYFNNQ